ncbi:MAG TPA: carboxypeptidase-like regulatory domain-containing protein [Blastocatellia bacterium]|nr:carboxypeptidase-like regulatory domain-containing protein [Blastocatellia bacterium]HMX25322.1 carboxypeptidase-like regulatory domain-containing protein [Blastocatellia bacterium]HMZ21795.1 carboxypeptidase-like regulatory domain-containing protein [Blastocatellia bacterium]HNG28569.1 carboxypeptidase-like regulatory domain-containing protein [Blastocatellia bacterium]
MKAPTLSRFFLQALVFAIMLALPCLAQITTTGIRGIVRDPNGAVIPGATVKATDNSTGVEQTTVTSTDGGFIFPALQFGSYKITVSATGFQNAVIAAVTVESGRTTNVSVDLSLGAATDTVQIAAATDQLNPTTAEVGTTINNKLVQNLPFAGRDSLNFAVLIAGSARSTSDRNSTFNGLPNASLNITLDGMNNNSQRFKSGGTSFFAFAPARIDAIEEVSVSTTGLGAEAGGEGAMQIRMTTKRGTEQYHGKVLYQGQNEWLNANSFFRNLQGLPRNKSRNHNPVGSIGGPLVPFSKRLKNKLFFFAYYEAQPQPSTQTYSTPILGASAQQGDFTYLATDGTKRTVNLLNVARAANHTSTIDPTMAGILKNINDSRGATATRFQDIPGVAPEFMQNMLWEQSLTTMQSFPTARVDFQITPGIGWHGTWNLRSSDFTRGTVPYPGSPYDFVGVAGANIHSSATPYVATNSVDWTINPNITNNASFGVQGNGEYFFIDADPKRFAEYNNRIINTPLVNPWIPNVATDVRNNPVYQFTDTLNWVKGRHTLTMGGTLLHTSFYSHSWNTAGVPQYNFGVVAADPMNNIIRGALPGLNLTNNNDINNALSLYALLTGRITSVSVATNADEKTREYKPFIESMQRYAFTTWGLYFQDSFRFRPSLTLNYGLRWQFDGDIHSGNELLSQPSGANFYGPSTGLFQPGVLSNNQNPVFELVVHPYKKDYMNPAPNFGFAWNPTFENGWLGKLVGERKTVLRGAYSITFYNEGLNSISNSLSGGQGFRQSGTATNGINFAPGTLELRSPAPAIPVFPATFGFPIPQNSFSAPVGGNYINPDLVSPYVQNWSLGIQRQLTRTTVLEARYVGNKSTHMWHRQNIQEVNIFENGFLNEFIQAKKNLDINVANGRGQTFANNNLPGQAALPIFQAAFGALGNQAALPAAQGFGNATYIQNLNQGTAGTLAQTIATTPASFCRLVGNKIASCGLAGFNTAGAYPINLFQANPYLSSLTYQDSNGDNNYNALQLDLKQSYSHGLLLGANYVWSHALGNIQNETDQAAGYTWYTLRNNRLNYGPSPFDRRHVFNAYWTYDLPFGKGHRFGNHPVLDRLVGGWTIGGRETIASGHPFLLNGGRNTVNNLTQSGVVFGNGFTAEQLQKAISTVSGPFSNVALISNISNIANITGSGNTRQTQVKPDLYAPASTPGQYSEFVYLRNNNLYTLDMSINKDIRITEKVRMTLRLVALNFLNHPFFDVANSSPTSTTFGQINSGSGTRTMQFRASIDW